MRRRVTLALAVWFAALWCAVFFRTETTAQSMVRAMLIEPRGGNWTIGLVYQFPQASADASEAAAAIRFGCASGTSFEQALLAAEDTLPEAANYRLCDHLLFGGESTLETLAACETSFLDRPLGRISARVFGADFSCADLLAASEEDDDTPERLLEAIKADADYAPRLYEHRQGCLLPVFTLDTSRRAEGLLLSTNGEVELSAEQAAAAWLLTGRGKTIAFQLDGTQVTLRARWASIDALADGCALRLYSRCRAGTPLPTQAQCAALAALCDETVRLCWEQGVDLLRLSAVRALHDGSLQTTKNACPLLRTDVVIF